MAPVNFAKPWLTYDWQVLTLVDKALIVSGDELTDKHINFAQALLKQQHDISGLWSSLLLSTMSSPVTTPALQIMHCRGNHWLVVTTIGCIAGVVKVYDSRMTLMQHVQHRSLALPWHDHANFPQNTPPSRVSSVRRLWNGFKQSGIRSGQPLCTYRYTRLNKGSFCVALRS